MRRKRKKEYDTDKKRMRAFTRASGVVDLFSSVCIFFLSFILLDLCAPRLSLYRVLVEGFLTWIRANFCTLHPEFQSLLARCWRLHGSTRNVNAFCPQMRVLWVKKVGEMLNFYETVLILAMEEYPQLIGLS